MKTTHLGLFYYVYISDPSDGWGDDQLGSEVLSSGETMSFSFGNGTYDIKVVDEDGDECMIFGYEHRGRRLVFNDDYYLDCINSDSYVSSLTIENNSSWSFLYIYISDPSEGWGDDVLGDEVLSSGETMSFGFSSGTYDIKIRDEDGDECILWGYEHYSNTPLVFDDDDWLGCIN